MFLLAYRNLRTRFARTILTAMAIALGVGMIFATRIVAAAVEETTGDARASRLAGADIEIATVTSAHLRADLAEEIAGRPEVEVATPTYQRLEGAFDATVELTPLGGTYPFTGTGLMLLGVDPARILTPYTLVEGSLLSAPDADEILLPKSWAAQQGVSVFDKVTLTTGTQTRTYTVVGLLEASPQERFTGQPAAWLPLATMQAAFDTPGAATAILIRLKPGTLPDVARDQLQEALGPLYVVTSATGGSGARPIMMMITDAALPFTGIAVLLAGSFLVYNAFAITMAERRREIGQLRTLGMTRGQVLRQVLAETLLVSLLGSGLGLILGLGLGRGMMEVFVGMLQGLPVPEIPVPLDGALLAVGAGILVTLATTLNLARKAGQASPLEALRIDPPRESERNWYVRWGWIAALGLVAAFFVVNAVVTGMMQEATSLDVVAALFLPPFILAGAALFALPVGARSTLWLLGKLATRLGVTTRLVTGNLARQRTRAILTTATLTISLMLVTTVAGITLTEKDFFKNNLLTLFDADFMLVHPSSFGTYEQRVSLPSLPPFSPELRAELDALAAEADVWYVANIQLPGYGSGPILDNGWALTLDLVRDNPIYRPREGSWAEADQYFVQGLALSLPEIAGRRLDLHPGDVVEVDTYEGRMTFTVAFIGGPLPLVTREVGERYFHSYPLLSLVNARPGSDKASLEAHLRELAREHTLAFTANTQEDFAGVINALFDVVLALFAGLTSISGLVGGLGIANTLIASVIERQREIGILRALGMSRAQVRWLIVSEAGLLGLTGAAIGVLAGLAMTLAFGHLIDAFGQVTGLAGGLRPWTQTPLPWTVAGAAIVAGPAMAMLAALYPAARAARVDPAEAMRAA